MSGISSDVPRKVYSEGYMTHYIQMHIVKTKQKMRWEGEFELHYATRDLAIPSKKKFSTYRPRKRLSGSFPHFSLTIANMDKRPVDYV